MDPRLRLVRFRRSITPDSLSIWTRDLHRLQYHSEFVPRRCSANAYPTISVAAGHPRFEIYDLGAAYKSIVAGGDDPDVGIGDHLTGGSHSPTSGQYGSGC